MFDGRFRTPVERAVKPLGQALRRTGLSPDHLTVAGLVVAVAAAVCIAQGRLVGGLFLVILAALPDLLDGALAKASGASSQRGAFFDSVIDRLTDALLFGGIAWYFASQKSPHLALLPFAVMGVSSVISYERAKAESLGLQAKGGLMERAERFIVLGFGLLFNPLFEATLWVMLVLTGITVITRFVKVWRQASGLPPRHQLRTRSRRRTARPVNDFRQRAEARAEARRRRRSPRTRRWS